MSREWTGVCPEQLACWLCAVPVALWCRSPGWLQGHFLRLALGRFCPLSALFPGVQAPSSGLSGEVWGCCGWPLPYIPGSSVALG